MMIKRIFLSLIPALCLSLLSSTVFAATAIFAAETAVSTISPCPSFCGGFGSASDFDFDGGVGQTTSYSSLNNVDGDGQAQSELSGQGELPVLKAEAFSHAQALPVRSSSVGAGAFGLQGFYVGASSYLLDIILTGIANDVPGPDFNEDGHVIANVMIIRDNDPNSDIEFTSHYPTMKFELIPGIDDLELLADAIDPLGQQLLVIPPDNVSHTVSATLEVSGLTPGELIYIWAGLNASGTRGGFGDAFSTLTLAFQDPTGLSHTAPVPLPAAIWFLGAGVLGVARRRRRSN
ncbi:MAG: VPLPA-CTERM sorting domain-containing protein [Proteobacteria bacterium]|nr:VPLPA-CTERM sorting domain-containing protein [Pseudomonadota bacterium]